jgi:hypothetical protein
MCSTLMLVQGRMEDFIHVFDTFLKSATTLSMTIKKHDSIESHNAQCLIFVMWIVVSINAIVWNVNNL